MCPSFRAMIALIAESAAPDRLAEGRYNKVPLLYHATFAKNALEIIRRGVLEPRSTATIDGKAVRGLSLTRSQSFANAYNTVIFGLDAVALKQRYSRRLVPYADPVLGRSSDLWGDHRREAEEFLVTDRPLPLPAILRAIWISDAPQEDPTHWRVAPFLREIERHHLFAGICRAKWLPGNGGWEIDDDTAAAVE